VSRDIYMVRVDPASGFVYAKELGFFRDQAGFTQPWGEYWVPVIASGIEDARHVGCALPGALPYFNQAHNDDAYRLTDTYLTTASALQAALQARKLAGRSIVQDWVCSLGLRYQGVLVAAVRGCDTAPRHDTSKVLQRIYRCEILNAHVGDPAKSKSFILKADIPTTQKKMQEFLDDCDHYPHHYAMHIFHAAEIVGYKHPDLERRDLWNSFYASACKKLHVKPESEDELRARLEAPEGKFEAAQKPAVRAEFFEAKHRGGT
jgi:hypothetical protein